jgi:hypothetical protein
MFCPKCGTQNPETGKFCRSCGTDIGVVTNALSGKTPGVNKFDYALAELEKKDKRRKNPDDVFANGIKEIFGSLGFIAVAIILAVTGIIGGKVWWFWLLIPAAAMIGNGIASIWKSKRMAKRIESTANQSNLLSPPAQNAALPPTNTEYVAPETRYKTGDLVPPSVTDGTTRHLEINTENETMTLPKK